MAHLYLLWLLAFALASQTAASRHARASNPRPAFSYKQLTRADILRRAALKHSRQLAPRARVSNAAYDTCSYAGDNTNGIYSTVSGSVTDGYGSEITGDASVAAATSLSACLLACNAISNCRFINYVDAGCHAYAQTANDADLPDSSQLVSSAGDYTAYRAVDCMILASSASPGSALNCCNDYTTA